MLCDPTTLPNTSFKIWPTHGSHPIALHLSLPAKSAVPDHNNNPLPEEIPPRTQFHSNKLKDPATRKKFSSTLEAHATKAEPWIQALKSELLIQTITATQYAERANAILVSALQATAEKILGKTAFRG